MKTVVIYSFIICGLFCGFSQNSSEHYLFNQFEQGTLLLKSGKSTKEMLNYNALTNEVVIKRDGKMSALLGSYVKTIDTVYVNGRKLVPNFDKFSENLINSKDVKLFVDYECTLKSKTEGRTPYGSSSQTGSPITIASVRDRGALYNMDLPGLYTAELKLRYRYMKGDKEILVKNLNQFKKLYAKHKKEFSKYKKENKVEFEQPETIKSLIEHLESLK